MAREAVTSRKQEDETGPEGAAALLAAARSLLSENGGSRFSLAEVARRSGKNVALVSYYFGGKEQMLLAILNEDEAAVLRPLQKLAALPLPAEEKLERHLNGMIDLHAKRPYLNGLIHELLRRSNSQTSEDIAHRFIRPVIAFQRELLEHGRREGAFRQMDPFTFYLNVMGSIDMLFTARTTIEFGFGCRLDDAAMRRRFVQQTMSLIMDGLRARPVADGAAA